MQELFDKMGIKPNNIDLYIEAFTHTSYANEHNTSSYERLEFLGDRVVDVIVSSYLYLQGLEEGQMTKTKASYVCENALAEYSKSLNFDKYIRLGKGEENKVKKAILADCFEAFAAALYLDLGFEKAKEVVSKIIIPYIEDESILFSDYKSELQEAVQDLQRDLNYELVEETGPAHNKQFKYVVKIDDIIYGEGLGHTKKEAEQEAAKKALEKLVRK